MSTDNKSDITQLDEIQLMEIPFVEYSPEEHVLDSGSISSEFESDKFVPFTSKSAEQINASVMMQSLLSKNYEDIDYLAVRDDLMKLANSSNVKASDLNYDEVSDYVSESTKKAIQEGSDQTIKGFSMADFSRYLENSPHIGRGTHKPTNSPANTEFKQDVINALKSPKVLAQNTKDSEGFDLLHMATLAYAEEKVAVYQAEELKQKWGSEIQNISKKILKDMQDPEVVAKDKRYANPELKDRLPKPAKYLQNYITPDGELSLDSVTLAESIHPVRKSSSASSFGYKKINASEMEDLELSEKNSLLAKTHIKNAEAYKKLASLARGKDLAERQKHPYYIDKNSVEKILDGEYDPASQVTKTTANIQMVRILTYNKTDLSHEVQLQGKMDNTILGEKVAPHTDFLIPDGSIMLKTGIDGFQNPSYSENAIDSNRSFAVLSINKPVNESGNIAICVTNDPKDAVVFSTSYDSKRYNSVLYTNPENAQNVINDLYSLNSDRSLDIIGDMRPESEKSKTEELDGVEFNPQASSGRDFAMQIETDAVSNKRDIKVLLPILEKPDGSNKIFESWSDVRDAFEQLAGDDNQLKNETVKHGFTMMVNNSIKQSVDRQKALEEIVKDTPDNTARLVEDKKKQIEQKNQAMQEPTIRNPSVSKPRM